MKLSIARINYPVTTLGPGNRVGIWTTGCDRNCPGCISPELQPFDERRQLSPCEIVGIIKSVPGVIDGCTIYQCFIRVILPITKASIVTVMVVQFVNVWNDLLIPRIFLTDQAKMTLPVGLTNFKSQYSTNYVGMIAAVILTIIPSIIVYIVLHKQIMEGMVAGAVKG